MSTTVPVTEAPIPSPDGTVLGHQKSIEGIKQNLEVHHGMLQTPAAATISPAAKGIAEAIYRVMHP